MFYYDGTYVLVLIGAILCIAASAHVKSAYRRFARVQSAGGLTGAEVAALILRRNGIGDVQIRQVPGELSDHYDPARQIVNLSQSVYGSGSIAAVSVAAHECGHVLQHQTGYFPLSIRTALVPAANIGSKLGLPMIVLGIMISGMLQSANGGVGILLAQIGVIAFTLGVLFQIITLPVEFDASRRALAMLTEYGILEGNEQGMARKVLSAAAMTYVAAAASSILQLIRILLIVRGANGRRKD